MTMTTTTIEHPQTTNQSRRRYTVDEYLDREMQVERTGGRKAEYINGEIREMAGGSGRHSVVAAMIVTILNRELWGKPFLVFQSDMRVRATRSGPYYYPDVTVSPVPAKIDRTKGETLLNPVVVVEVASPSTENIDRSEKLMNYGRIGTVTDYLIAAQNKIHLDHYSKQVDGTWQHESLTDAAEMASLSSVGVELKLADVYVNAFADGLEERD